MAISFKCNPMKISLENHQIWWCLLNYNIHFHNTDITEHIIEEITIQQ